MREKAVVVNVSFESGMQKKEDLVRSAEELRALCGSACLEVVADVTARPKEPNASLLLGSGKAHEIRSAAQESKADVVVFGCDLSPSQQRNLEALLDTKTIDRTQLILDIFARRAREAEGKLQVELAQLEYLLPRLAGQGIYLSRQGGGVGTRGPGEQKLEMDRRRIRQRINRLKKELEVLDRRRLAAIERKKEKAFTMIALVGYTNAGKSTLFNRLTQAEVLVKNKLFSTLETTTRSLELPKNQKALLSDTVGFVRDLPHGLIESFKATLEEARHAQILLHVIDASAPDQESQRRAVDAVLAELEVEAEHTFLVFNKTDLMDAIQRRAIEARCRELGAYNVSALTGQGLEALLGAIGKVLSQARSLRSYFITRDRQELVHYFYENAEVLSRKDAPEGITFKVRIAQPHKAFIEKKLKEGPGAS